MQSSFFGWLDYNDAERRQMMDVISLFREKGTLDELGIGTIRDTFSDYFFPGTSTIQTRARYFLFIPWIYQIIEAERVPSAQVRRRARELQAALVRSLRSGGMGPNSGLIGIDAGANLRRLPSDIYWQGLRRWSIRVIEASIERYDATLDAQYLQERAARTSDGGELLETARRNWHPSVPIRPADFLASTTFDLTADEADFLIERVRWSAPGTLLAACLTARTTRKAAARAPWEIGGIDSLAIELRSDIEHARRFSLAMEGASLLYTLMIVELADERGLLTDAALPDRYRIALDRWADEIIGDNVAFRAWDRPEFWSRLTTLNPRLSSRAMAFSDAWIALASSNPHGVVADPMARTLIRNRERQTKQGLARLHNPRALEHAIPGWSGGGRLTFRWGSAQRIVLDILRGAQLPADVA
jgi:hypothetical protein